MFWFISPFFTFKEEVDHEVDLAEEVEVEVTIVVVEEVDQIPGTS